MRRFLIFQSILVILLPFVIIIQNLMGKELISAKEYFVFVLMFLLTYFLYKNKDSKV